jgi:hypothetical protein
MRTVPLFFLIAALVILPASAYYIDAPFTTKSDFSPKFNASFPGERNAGQWYDFSIANVSGDKDVTYHFTVYDAQFRDDYEYRSDAWGQWWTESPAQDKKFLFIWICGYSEGTSWWGWGPDRFSLWINGSRIDPEPVIISDIGKVRRGMGWSSQVPPRTIRFMENRTSYQDFTYSQDAYGFRDGIEQTRMESMKSNAWNGYLIFQVPRTSTFKDMQILGWFGNSGSAWWNLELCEIVQESPEYLEVQLREKITYEISNGARLRENEERRRSA